MKNVITWVETPKCINCIYHKKDGCKLKECAYPAKRWTGNTLIHT
jgi:hypothetical protein